MINIVPLTSMVVFKVLLRLVVGSIFLFTYLIIVAYKSNNWGKLTKLYHSKQLWNAYSAILICKSWLNLHLKNKRQRVLYRNFKTLEKYVHQLTKYTIKIIGGTCSNTVFRGKTINLITAKFSEQTTFLISSIMWPVYLIPWLIL